MSWWVYLEDSETGATLYSEVRHTQGGTYVLGGTRDMELNITYNYDSLFRDTGVEINRGSGNLHGRKASETIPMLEKAVEQLGNRQSEDYWKPTRGNAGWALTVLLRWARECPQGVWRVS